MVRTYRTEVNMILSIYILFPKYINQQVLNCAKRFKISCTQVILRNKRQSKFCERHWSTSHPLEPLVQPRLNVSHWHTKCPTWRGGPQETKADESSCTKAHMGKAQHLDFTVAIIALEFKR